MAYILKARNGVLRTGMYSLTRMYESTQHNMDYEETDNMNEEFDASSTCKVCIMRKATKFMYHIFQKSYSATVPDGNDIRWMAFREAEQYSEAKAALILFEIIRTEMADEPAQYLTRMYHFAEKTVEDYEAYVKSLPEGERNVMLY